jgi:hypothetical protein
MGRVAAVGALGYNVHIGHLPVSARVKVLREVEVENRFQGTIASSDLVVPWLFRRPRRRPAA